MRVLLLTPSVRPLGARRSMVELIRHLPPGVEPLAVCPEEGGISLEIKDLGVDVRVVPQGAWRKFGGRLKALFRQLPGLWRIVGDFRPDVLHANEFHIVPQSLAAAGKKCPVTAHVRLSITPRQIATYRMARCRRIVCVSEAVSGLFAGTSAADRVRVIPNGVNVAPMAQQAAPHPGLAEWSAAFPRPLVAGLLGLVSERKNQLVAAAAVALARARGADVRLFLAGDAHRSSVPYGEALRERLAAPDLREAVCWLPFQREVAPLYHAMDVNLLISGEEGFGRTIIEAGAAGHPSIGSRIGGIPELIEDGRTGWLVPEGDAEALAAQLVELAADPEAVRVAGEAAREHVRRHFTIEAHASRMVSLWEESIEEFRAGR